MDQNRVWEIPFGVSVPPPGSVQNLLSVCAPSASHVGFQPLRVEPTWMTIGQAVGVAAALANKQHLQPRQLGASVLQAALRRHGMILSASEMKPTPVERSCGRSVSPSPPQPASEQPVFAVPCNVSEIGATQYRLRSVGIRWKPRTSSDGAFISFEADPEPVASHPNRDPPRRKCLSVGDPREPEPTSKHGVRVTLTECSDMNQKLTRSQQWISSVSLGTFTNATLRSALDPAPRCFGSYSGDNCTLLTALAWEPTYSKTLMLWTPTTDAVRHPQRWPFNNAHITPQGAGLCLAHNTSDS